MLCAFDKIKNHEKKINRTSSDLMDKINLLSIRSEEVLLIFFLKFMSWTSTVLQIPCLMAYQFLGLFNPESILPKGHYGYYLIHSWKDKAVHFFPLGYLSENEYNTILQSNASTTSPRGHPCNSQ